MFYLQSNALPAIHLYTCTWLHDQSSVFSFSFSFLLQAQKVKSSKYISLTQICIIFFRTYWSVLYPARHIPLYIYIYTLNIYFKVVVVNYKSSKYSIFNNNSYRLLIINLINHFWKEELLYFLMLILFFCV